jgi:hypothetical protein
MLISSFLTPGNSARDATEDVLECVLERTEAGVLPGEHAKNHCSVR